MRTAALAAFATCLAVAAAHAQQTQGGKSARPQAGSMTGGVEFASPPPPTIAKLPTPPGVPAGIWLLPLQAAVQIYDCDGRLCGRIVWLSRPRDPEGQLVLDKKNPDPSLRRRPICGLPVLWGLQPAGLDHWKNGWLYNPDEGKTYRVQGQFRGADTLVVRVYVGIPLLGRTSVWQRVPRLSSEGWC